MSTRAALRYAKAVLRFANEQNQATDVYKDMQSLLAVVSEHKELQTVLNNPTIKSEAKKKIINTIFDNKLDKITQGLLDTLISNKRLPIIANVASQYITLYDAHHGKQVAEVTTAVPLDEALSTLVLAKVKALTGKEAIIKNNVNPDIIGGFILRIGDIQYNASIANKLSNLKREFTLN